VFIHGPTKNRQRSNFKSELARVILEARTGDDPLDSFFIARQDGDGIKFLGVGSYIIST
jgi:hypothetical protein